MIFIFSEKVIWLPFALRIGLPGSSALQKDGLAEPVILQSRTPRETNSKGQWGAKLIYSTTTTTTTPTTTTTTTTIFR
jgi:hypothetical protein